MGKKYLAHIQSVPLASQLTGGPLLRVARIRRTTDTLLFISHTTNALLFKFRCNIFISVRIIKEMRVGHTVYLPLLSCVFYVYRYTADLACCTVSYVQRLTVTLTALSSKHLHHRPTELNTAPLTLFYFSLLRFIFLN